MKNQNSFAIAGLTRFELQHVQRLIDVIRNSSDKAGRLIECLEDAANPCVPASGARVFKNADTFKISGAKLLKRYSPV